GRDTPRDVGILSRLADANLSQRLPNTSLEGCAADVKGKFEADPGYLEEADNPRDQSLIVAIGTNEMRFRETILEIAHKLVRVVSHRIAATPFLLEATRTAPREVCPTANLISSFVPPARYCNGVMPSMSIELS